MNPVTGGPSTGNEFTTSSVLQQNNSLLGNPQIPAAAGSNNPMIPSFDPQMMTNSTQGQMAQPGMQNNVQNMIKALQNG